MGLPAVLSGLKDAKVFDRGAFLDEGVYDVEICRCLVKDTRKSGSAFIVEMKILKSSNPKHPVGSSASWFQKLTDKDIALGALMEFAAPLMGVDSKDRQRLDSEVRPMIEPFIAEALDNGGKGAAGEKVHVEVVKKKTQKGFDFSAHNWSPYQG